MNTPTILKRDAIAAYGGNASALARALGVTPSAVYQWDEGPIDERYALKLVFVLRPEGLRSSDSEQDRNDPTGAVGGRPGAKAGDSNVHGRSVSAAAAGEYVHGDAS